MPKYRDLIFFGGQQKCLSLFLLFCFAHLSPHALYASNGASGFSHEALITIPEPMSADQETITLALNPKVRLYKNFLSPLEAAHLISLAQQRLKPSTVLIQGKSVLDPYRTSSTAYIYRSEDAVVKRIEERICQQLACNLNQMEPLQIIHYTYGQKFSPHWDYFSEQEVVLQKGQRLHSLVIYLNELLPSEGGMTVFPQLNIKVQPRLGMALYFRNLDEQGKVNPLTLHGGEPILSNHAEKWACTVWICEGVYIPA